MDNLITILVPCRERHEATKNLLKSIQQKTTDPSRVRVITVTDFDRPEDSANIGNYYTEQDLPYELFNISRSRNNELNKNYYNLANLMAESYFSWILGNDCIIETQGWDDAFSRGTKDCISEIENDSSYFYVHVNDDTHVPAGNKECMGNCFPILSQNYCKKVRGPMPESNHSWDGDVQLFHGFRKIPGHKFIDLTDSIKVSHVSHHTGKAPQDEVNSELQATADDTIGIPMNIVSLAEQWGYQRKMTQFPLFLGDRNPFPL